MLVKNWLALCIIAILASNIAFAQGSDWPKWRGINNDGISPETQWNPNAIQNPKILWEKNVGEGYATVSVQGDRLYTLGNTKKKDIIYCLDSKTGKEIWTYSYDCPAGSYPGSRATPIVDNGSVYSLSREGHIICLHANTGELKWKLNIQDEYSAEIPRWGFASSPVISGNKLLLNVGANGIAFDKLTGKLLWKSDTSEMPGYASIMPFMDGNVEYAVVFSGKTIALIYANTGIKIWSHPWITSYDVNAADPIISGKKMFISSGYGTGCASFSLEGSKPKLLWKNEKMRNHFGTCVLINGYLYGIDGQTFGESASLKCLDFQTGEEKWQKTIGFGSVIASNNKLITLTDKGVVLIAEATPKGYKEIASGQVLFNKGRDNTCWNIPILSHGRLYCRNSKGQLVCVDLR